MENDDKYHNFFNGTNQLKMKVPPRKMLITIVRGGGGGKGVMIEIIISLNDENDGRPLI